MRRHILISLMSLLTLAVLAGSAHAAVTRSVIDGPSPDIADGGYDIAAAPDGTAAVVYGKQVGGDAHVFVSRYEGGWWTAPERLDEGLANASSNASVGVGNGGRVVVTFLNNTQMYAALKPAAGQPFQRSEPVPGAAANREIEVDMNPAGIAYAAYVDFDFHARAARLEGTTWQQVGAPFHDAGGHLNNDPAKQVETNNDAFDVAVAGDGNGAVAWQEEDASNDDQTYVRRLNGTARGDVQRASIDSLNGHAHAAFGDMISLDGDGAGAFWVAQRQLFDYSGSGGADEPRLIARRLPPGGAIESPNVIDGLPNEVTSGAEFPMLDANASGQVLAGHLRQEINETWGSAYFGGSWSAFMLDPNVRSRTVPALGDSGGGALSFARNNTVVARPWDGAAPAPEVTLSDGTLEGVGMPAAAADGPGSAFVAFTERTSATARRLVVARIGEIVTPGVTGLGVVPRRLAVGRRAPVVLAARRTARITFNLSEEAAVRMSFSRARPGRRVNGHCVKQTRRNRGRRRCTRYVRVRGGVVNFAGKAGDNRVRFQGRVTRRRKLRPGGYRVTVVATDAEGNVSAPRHAKFRIVRR